MYAKSAKTLVNELKDNQQDFEWYPTKGEKHERSNTTY
jgi:hypothetical protein